MALLKRICVFTGSRSEYGLLRPVIREFKSSTLCQTLIICSGSHLSPEHGQTFREIEDDGFAIDDKIEILLSSDTAIGASKSFALAVMGVAESLNRLQPDLIVVLGDRFEALAAAISASLAKIPIAHIAGGEKSLGAIDEVFRHSITKLSHLHFASTEEYRGRIVSMGEAKNRVFHVGSTAIDNIAQYEWLTKDALEKSLGFAFKRRNILVTFHPETLARESPKDQFSNLLAVLENYQDYGIVFTKANADAGGREINDMIDAFVDRYKTNAVAVTSLGTHKYLSVLRLVDVVIGNSSSGIIEAPSFKKPVVDIGGRQGGRVKARNVIECHNTFSGIHEALERSLEAEWVVLLDSLQNPYDAGGASRKIREIVERTDLNELIPKYLDSQEAGS